MRWSSRHARALLCGAVTWLSAGALQAQLSCEEHDDCPVDQLCEESAGICRSIEDAVPRLESPETAERLGTACGFDDDDYFDGALRAFLEAEPDVERIVRLGLSVVMAAEDRRNPIYIVAKDVKTVQSAFYRRTPEGGPIPVIEYSPSFIRRLMIVDTDRSRQSLLFVLAHEYAHLSEHDHGAIGGWHVPRDSTARTTDGTVFRHELEFAADRDAIRTLAVLGGELASANHLFDVLDAMQLGGDSATHPSTARRREVVRHRHQRLSRRIGEEIALLMRAQQRLRGLAVQPSGRTN